MNVNYLSLVLCVVVGVGCVAHAPAVCEDANTAALTIPSRYFVVHGDGAIQRGEMCDDGNTRDGDGCSADGTLESGFKCKTPGIPCEETFSRVLRLSPLEITSLNFSWGKLSGVAVGQVDPVFSVSGRTLNGSINFGVQGTSTSGVYFEFVNRHIVEGYNTYSLGDEVQTSGIRWLYLLGEPESRFRWFAGVEWLNLTLMGSSVEFNSRLVRPQVHAMGVAVPLGFKVPVFFFPLTFRGWVAPFTTFSMKGDNIRASSYSGVLVMTNLSISLLEVSDILERL